MTPSVLLAAATLLATGCSAGAGLSPDPAPLATTSEGARSADPAPTGTARPTAQEIVEDPDARLSSVAVTRSKGSFRVTSVWSLERQHLRFHALAESDDGFRTGRYSSGGHRKLLRATEPPKPDGVGPYETCSRVAGDVDLCFDYDRTRASWTGDGGRTWSSSAVDLGRLMPWPVDSLAPDTFAVAGGGDGATLFPFERVVASVDGGGSWSRSDVPGFGGQMAYSAGQVVTADGRLVALLDHFSDDRPQRPSERHHGLWTSSGADWSGYTPLLPRMTPRPAPSPDGWAALVTLGASADPEPMIWVTTWDHRLYVSTDDARTFQRIPVR